MPPRLVGSASLGAWRRRASMTSTATWAGCVGWPDSTLSRWFPRTVSTWIEDDQQERVPRPVGKVVYAPGELCEWGLQRANHLVVPLSSTPSARIVAPVRSISSYPKSRIFICLRARARLSHLQVSRQREPRRPDCVSRFLRASGVAGTASMIVGTTSSCRSLLPSHDPRLFNWHSCIRRLWNRQHGVGEALVQAI
jgi:hypothetical protein